MTGTPALLAPFLIVLSSPVIPESAPVFSDPDFRELTTPPREVDKVLSGPATVLHSVGLALAFVAAFFSSFVVVAAATPALTIASVRPLAPFLNFPPWYGWTTYRFIRNSDPPRSVTNRVFANARVLLVGHEEELGPVAEDGLIDVDVLVDDVEEAELAPASAVGLDEPPQPPTSSVNNRAGTTRSRERICVPFMDVT